MSLIQLLGNLAHLGQTVCRQIGKLWKNENMCFQSHVTKERFKKIDIFKNVNHQP